VCLAEKRAVDSSKSACQLLVAVAEVADTVVYQHVERRIAGEGVAHILARSPSEETAKLRARVGVEIAFEDGGGGSGGGRGRETIEATQTGD
jgi:hypothetical protein